jgi:hypothetical protein
MLFRSNNDIGADELTTAWFKFLGASIAIILMAREAAPAELTPGFGRLDAELCGAQQRLLGMD